MNYFDNYPDDMYKPRPPRFWAKIIILLTVIIVSVWTMIRLFGCQEVSQAVPDVLVEPKDTVVVPQGMNTIEPKDTVDMVEPLAESRKIIKIRRDGITLKDLFFTRPIQTISIYGQSYIVGEGFIQDTRKGTITFINGSSFAKGEIMIAHRN